MHPQLSHEGQIIELKLIKSRLINILTVEEINFDLPRKCNVSDSWYSWHHAS